MRFERIVSGGQTGVDRAALDVALEHGLPCGGWCPRGRRAEDGPLPGRYPLQETPWGGYPQRTAWNVRDSDGTLILTWGEPDGGTAYTVRVAKEMGRPVLVVQLDDASGVQQTQEWIDAVGVRILNVAGPRETTAPGIYAAACQFLHPLFTRSAESPNEREPASRGGCGPLFDREDPINTQSSDC